MSTLKVEVVKIDNVARHPNADRLDLVQVKGWHCVAGRTNPDEPKYKAGDNVIYLPIDSIVPPKLEAYLFPPDSKVKLSKSRIKTIKLRGAISQGMVFDITPELVDLYPRLKSAHTGTDVTETLGVVKYEPPAKDIPELMRPHLQKKKFDNHHFSKYCDIENFKNYPNAFEEYEQVYITEKLHGTSARYALLPSKAVTLWQKFLKFIGRLPKFQFCYGSRNVQLQGKLNKQTFYSTDVYGHIAKKLDIKNKLKPGEQLFGEIVGFGIQTGYSYGLGPNEFEFYAYDVKQDGKYLNPQQFLDWCAEREVQTVPKLYMGPLNIDLEQFVKGDSTIRDQKVREGIVIKSQQDTCSYFGRKVLKRINDEYLLKDQSEFH